MRVHDREPIGAALRRFNKLLERSGLTKELRKRKYYEKPCEARRRWPASKPIGHLGCHRKTTQYPCFTGTTMCGILKQNADRRGLNSLAHCRSKKLASDGSNLPLAGEFDNPKQG
jgi:small subunit ribosomal protein S21